MARPLPKSPHEPDRLAATLLRMVKDYATPVEGESREDREQRIVGLQHIWHDALHLWEDAMADGQDAGISLSRQVHLTGLKRSNVQTRIGHGRARRKTAA
ncbi:MAG: hypothetical protein JWO67_3174 [Streptosporangiaceae bacterium]|nr:hypothetical protein [Streptosporangiaceae bacterium]